MSTINRGPLGSAFLINREAIHGNGGGGGSSTAFSTEPQSSASSNNSKPPSSASSSSSTTAIPMPGPTLAESFSSPMPPDAFSTSMAGSNIAPPGAVPVAPPRGSLITTDLVRSLAEVKGQAQFLLYLADQIEDSLHQLIEEHDDCQNAFLCRILSMYSGQLETKHHGLGDKIAETCQEVYVTVREYDAT